MSRPLWQLPKRISPRKSSSKTKATTPRTFSSLESWPELLPEALQLEDNLDNTACIYQEPTLSIEPGEHISPAADECEVRGCIMAFLQGVNQAARVLGFGVECVGGGSGRTTSFMNLVLRVSGRPSDPNQLSCLILGAGEMKGTWQFNLQRGDTLEDLLQHPLRIDAFLLALQQAS